MHGDDIHDIAYCRMDINELDTLSIELRLGSDNMAAASNARSILVINPNSTKSMTDALVPLVDELAFKEVSCLSLGTLYI